MKQQSVKAQKFTKKRGQSSVEYLLVLAVMVGAVAIFGKTFKAKISSVTDSLFGGVDSSVKGMMNPR